MRKDHVKCKLTEHDFLNPNFVPVGANKEYLKEHPASNLAYLANGLVSSALAAFEGNASGLPLQGRGIEQTLFVANSIISDLIDLTESLENELVQMRKVSREK